MAGANRYSLLLTTLRLPSPSISSLKRLSQTPLFRALFLLSALLSLLTLHLFLSFPPPTQIYVRAPAVCTHVPPRLTVDGEGRRWEAPSVAFTLKATLEMRLAAWKQSPIANGSDWRVFNDETCGNESVRRNENVVLREKAEEVWRLLETGERIREVRDELVGVLERAEKEGKLVVREEEKGRRGIVFTAGNAVRPSPLTVARSN